MIRIDEMTRGRFGNKILHYNSLVQLADSMGTEASCVPWEGVHIFDDLENHKVSTEHKPLIEWKDILSNNIPTDIDHLMGPYCIHNIFWKVTKKDPRNFFKVNSEYKKNFSNDKVHVGIHLRGADILGADGNQGREIHSPKYYMDAIELVESEFENTYYHICTDDMNFESFIETITYLGQKNYPFELGSPNHFVDFSTLSECDIIIASSSTFAVAAGFSGKEDKKIIHSMEWIQKNLDHTPWHPYEDPENIREWQLSFDNFWVELYNGGNEFYHVWKFV